MQPQSDLDVQVEVAAAEITATDVLDEFLRIQHEWGFPAFRHPLSQGICGGVELPGPDELLERAALANLWAELYQAGRI